jgi:hypothetical protein
MTSYGLDPGHYQTYMMIRTYEKIHIKIHVLTLERDLITLHKNHRTCSKKQRKTGLNPLVKHPLF